MCLIIDAEASHVAVPEAGVPLGHLRLEPRSVAAVLEVFRDSCLNGVLAAVDPDGRDLCHVFLPADRLAAAEAEIEPLLEEDVSECDLVAWILDRIGQARAARAGLLLNLCQ